MRVLELFSGTASFSNVAKERGHETFTIDIDPSFHPDLVADIEDIQITDLPEVWQHPDVVWASPPCQCFSVAALYRNWQQIGAQYHPKRPEANQALHLVSHTLELVNELRPLAYFIENPRATLRVLDIMNRLPKRRTVTYCRYGAKIQKPTDIWTNFYGWQPRPMCKPRSPCHESAPRGSKKGIQGIERHGGKGWDGLGLPRSATLRAIVPPALCEEILIACERALLRQDLDGSPVEVPT